MNQLDADATYGVGIHVVVLPGVLLADVSPGSGLPYVVAELLVVGDSFTQVVDRHTKMLYAFLVCLEEVGIDVRGSRRGGDPFVAELSVVLVADIKGKPQWLSAVG